MKKTFLVITVLLSLSQVSVFAQTITPTAKPTSESATEKLSDQINNLKEKIASRVAQLNLVEKRGFVGTVKDVSANQLTANDTNGVVRNIDVDEITKFSSSGKESFGLSDLKAGSVISVIGLYNKDSARLLARFINAYTSPLYLSGIVTNPDKTAFTLTLAMEENKSYVVDVENITKISTYSDDVSEKIGFSKIPQNTRAIIIGYADKKEKNRMVATRVLLFPKLPKNPAITIVPNAIDTSSGAITSSGSGKKLTPIK
jgi:hypothetical protein